MSPAMLVKLPLRIALAATVLACTVAHAQPAPGEKHRPAKRPQRDLAALRAPMVNPVDVPLYTIHMGPEYLSTWVFGGHGKTAIPPIPAGFFGSGSDAWSGPISCVGQPLDPKGPAPTADLVVRHEKLEWIPNPEKRYGPAEIPKKWALRCDMVKLSERAVKPIIVTYDGGKRREEWDVTIHLARNHPGGGMIEITQINPDGNGGLCDIEICVKVLFRFSKPGLDKPLELTSDPEWLSETDHTFTRWVTPDVARRVYVSSDMQGSFIPASRTIGGRTDLVGACSQSAAVSHSFVLSPQAGPAQSGWGTSDAIRQFAPRQG